MIANNQAVRLANIGAAHGDLKLHVSKPVIRYAYIAKQIQAWFATVICNLPDKPKPNIISQFDHTRAANHF